MNAGRKLLRLAVPGMRIMKDSMTSQGLIKEMNHKVQMVVDGRVEEKLHSDVTIFADEVANLFSYDRVRAAQMTIFLTTAYNCDDEYEHTIARNDSKVILYNVYPVFLGGTDPRNLKTIPDEAAGGLTGRLIWVIAKDRRINDSGWVDEGDLEDLQRDCLREYLIHDLRRISKLQGPMQITAEAKKIFDAWYADLSTRKTEDHALDAFHHRCHDTARRISIILSVTQGDEKIIHAHHMKAAIYLVEQQMPETQKATMWTGNSLFQQSRAKFITFLQANGTMTKETVLLKHMGIDKDEFARLRATLEEDGTIRVVHVGKMRGISLVDVKDA
jgi:hypothetical protein